MYDRTVSPYIFENAEGITETVNREWYQHILNTFLRYVVIHLRNCHELRFQQDGETYHTANEPMDVLQGKFGNNIISRRAALTWPPWSPDLNAPHSNLWEYLEEIVYINRPENLEDLKDNIRREIRAISPVTLRSVMNNALASSSFV